MEPRYDPGMTGSELEVLEANEAFYRAFAARDFDGMASLWAERHPVACAHPGWDVLDGREEVLESWRGILESPASPAVGCSLAQARVLGEVAFVTCQETLPGIHLAATNLFVREGGSWRLIHHQASLIAPGQERDGLPAGPKN